MADRPWVKLWESWWTSKSHAKIGPDALLVGLALVSLVRWRKGQDAAWAEFEDGDPVPLDVIAARTQMTAGRTIAALTLLAKRRTAARRDDGAWGMPNCGKYQETPEAAKKRKQRATVPGQTGDMSRDKTGDAEADADAGFALQTNPPTPEPGKPGGKGSRKRPPAKPDARVATVIDRVDVHRARLGLAPLSESARVPNTIAARLKAGVGLDELLAVADAFGRLADRDPSKRTLLNPTTPFTGPNGERGGGFAWGQRMVEEERAATPGKPSLNTIPEWLQEAP